MIRNITIGQFYPVKSLIHTLDPRTKILWTILYMVLLFSVKTLLSYLFIALVTLFIVYLSRVPMKFLFRGLKPLLFLLIFTALINLFMTVGESGTELFSYGIIRIYPLGVKTAVNMIIRLVLLVTGSSILTFTTSPIVLTNGIERLLSPFKKIGVPSHEIAMMMSIALRFIPTLLEETDKIIKAQSARGADFETGKISQRIKALLPILVPLFVSAFRRADELALAMESRCYHGGEDRTALNVLSYSVTDLYALLFSVFVTFGIIVLNRCVL